MASTTILYSNRYDLNITDNIHHRFILLPWDKPSGKYTYFVWIEKRSSWLTDSFFWCSRLVDSNNNDAYKNEIALSDFYYDSRRFAFVAELVNYAQKFDYWEESRLFNSHQYDYELSNFILGDKLENSNFEVKVDFSDVSFKYCLETFNSFGIDINKYDTYYRYKWIINITSAKLYYDNECIYNHPKPLYVLAMLGWHIAPKAQ